MHPLTGYRIELLQPEEIGLICGIVRKIHVQVEGTTIAHYLNISSAVVSGQAVSRCSFLVADVLGVKRIAAFRKRIHVKSTVGGNVERNVIGQVVRKRTRCRRNDNGQQSAVRAGQRNRIVILTTSLPLQY